MIKAFRTNILAKRVGVDNKNSAGVVKTSSNKEKPLTVVIVDSEVDNVPKDEKYLIARYSGTEIEYDGEDFIVITEDDIIARVSK